VCKFHFSLNSQKSKNISAPGGPGALLLDPAGSRVAKGT